MNEHSAMSCHRVRAVAAAFRVPAVGAVAALMIALPLEAAAQGRGNARNEIRGNAVLVRTTPTTTTARVLSSDLRSLIRDFYGDRSARRIASLPPGIRKNLARGKPLPPGIARQLAPAELQRRVRVPQGYRLVETGADLLLVEVATNLIHDILVDVVR